MPAVSVLLCLIAYLVATGVLVRGLAQAEDGEKRTGWVAPAVLAMVFHAELHAEAWRASAGFDMHFFAALSLVALGMAGLTVLFGLAGRMSALGVVVFPLAAIFALAYHLHGHPAPQPLGWKLLLHAWLALLAYATLGIAALLAIVLRMQEQALRQRHLARWMRVLPPLVELESLLFRTIGVGFLLLTATLLTGVLFVDDLLAQHLAHKTVFSILSWIAFAALLFGRWRLGWRGRRAVTWTLAAMALLVLAFFGSKFVLELVLGRA